MDDLTEMLTMAVSAVPAKGPDLEDTSDKPRLSFSTINPRLQLAWDSVSLGAAKKCARYYQLAIVEGWQSKYDNIHLRFGQLYHRVLEYYDHMRFAGHDHEAAMRLALRDLAEGCQNTIVCRTCNGTSITYPSDGSDCKPCPTCKGSCVERVWWNPEEYLSEEKRKLNTKTIYTLFRSAVWYMDKFRNDSCKTVMLANGKPAVELSFRYELGYTFRTGEAMLHCGHMDRLVELSEDNYVLDRKTTKNTLDGGSAMAYFRKYCPDNQMTGYTFAGRLALAKPIKGVIIDAVQIAKGFSRFERGFSMRTDAQLDEWRIDTLMKVAEMERYAETGYYPMNDTACDHYGGCAFRGICSKDPSVREAYLKGDFIKRPWDPLQVRGDI